MTDPNFHTRLAAALRAAADKVEKIDPSVASPESVRLHICAGWTYDNRNAAKSVAIVDGIAAALDTKAFTKVEGRGQDRRAEHGFDLQLDNLSVHVYARIPAPPTRAQKLADLQAENDALRAKLAKAGEQA